MNYPLGVMLVVVILFLGFISIQLFYWIKRQLLLKKLKKLPFPKNYEKILNKIPIYQNLPIQEQTKIKYSILVFINEKEFIGLYELNISDEIKIVVSFYACILLIHKEFGCYPNLSTIYIYPYEFISKEIKSYGGLYTEEKFILEGQSSGDSVVISWHNAKKEAYHLHYSNVIIHEFAHEIDFLDGYADGIPPMAVDKYSEWSKIMFKEYKKLKDKSIKGRYFGKYRLIGEYASTNEAEFFAVTTERFFESPKQLNKKFPNIYKELKEFYKIDPLKIISKDFSLEK